MTREEARELLGENATNEQIQALLDKVHDNNETYKKQLKEAQDKATQLEKQVNKYSDYDDIKKQLDDINKANMTKEEQLTEREKEILKKEQETNRRDNRSIVKEIVAGLNISDEVIESLISESADVSKKNAENLVAQINAIKEATIKETKENLLNVDVQPDTKDSVQKTTKKWNEMTYEEKLELKRSNPQEYETIKQSQ